MAVANPNPITDLQEELTCPICLDHFKDPVSIECGHSFCRHCILRTWRGIHSNFSCPQCRKTSKWKFLRPNRLVENVVEIANRLLAAKINEVDVKTCKKHQEPLKLYCQEDAQEICLVCRESVFHKTHAVIPLEELTREFKGLLKDQLQTLKKEVAEILQRKSEENGKSQKLECEVVLKRKMMASEFENLRLLLADHERDLNDRWENIEKIIKQTRTENITKLNVKISALQKRIADIEKNGAPSVCQHPELKTTVNRNTRETQCFEAGTYNPYGLTTSTWEYLKMFTVSRGDLRKLFKDLQSMVREEMAVIRTQLRSLGIRYRWALPTTLTVTRNDKQLSVDDPASIPEFLKDLSIVLLPLSIRRYNTTRSSRYTYHLKDLCVCLNSLSDCFPATFDQRTANPNLFVSSNRKLVRYEEHPRSVLPCPDRFDMKPCVLGITGYKNGKRYWEVEVGGGIYWSVGVAKQSVCRKGAFKIEPNCGIWAIGLLGMYTDRYYAFTNPDILLHPKEHPIRVGVFLDCDEQGLSFYNAETMEHLHTFTHVHSVDKIYPFFCVELWEQSFDLINGFKGVSLLHGHFCLLLLSFLVGRRRSASLQFSVSGLQVAEAVEWLYRDFNLFEEVPQPCACTADCMGDILEEVGAVRVLRLQRPTRTQLQESNWSLGAMVTAA
ncbi:LOW QUALITY PROTEIN: E3 ubiquitin-protein ligase TRIM39-like [Pelodytes ibericus]